MEGIHHHRHVGDVINASRISSLQYLVFAVCFFIVAIDGFDTAVMGFVAPAIAQEWSLGPHSLAILLTAGLLGAITGTTFLGPLADTFGRTRTMLASTALFGILTALAAGVNNMTMLVILRFIAGVFFGGVLPCAIALTAEYSPDRRRSSIITAMFCGFTIGSASVGFLAAWMVPEFGWRAVLMAGGAAAFIVSCIGWILLPESLNFLVSKNMRPAEVRRTLSRIAPSAAASGWMPKAEPQPAGSPVSALFEARPLSGTLLLWITAFMGLMCTYLLANWLPVLLTSEEYSLRQASIVTAMFQVGGTVGAILLGLAMDRFKPNRVLTVAWLCAGLFLVAIGFVIQAPVAVAVAVFFAGFCIPGGQVGSQAYAAAWYPTQIRTTGISWMAGVGRTGALLGSLSAGGLLAIGLSMSSIVALLSVPMIIAAVAMALHERVRVLPIRELALERSK
jgi:AAHS family 4-hydroxybenzoate transporter-like MFS transporter